MVRRASRTGSRVVKTGGICKTERKGKRTAEEGSTDEQKTRDRRVGARTRGLEVVATARRIAPGPTEMRVSERTLAGRDAYKRTLTETGSSKGDRKIDRGRDAGASQGLVGTAARSSGEEQAAGAGWRRK